MIKRIPGRHLRNVLHTCIFGGNGFLGRQIIRRLSQYPNLRIWSYDKRQHDVLIDTEDAKAIVEQVQGNLEDALAAAFLPANQADIIIYCAGYEAPPVGLSGRPLDNLQATAGLINVLEGMGKMLEVHDRSFVPYFCYISSWTVYGAEKKKAHTESCVLSPATHSGALKMAAEDLVKRYCYRYEVPYSIVRPTEIYGRREHEELISSGFFPGHLLTLVEDVCRQAPEITLRGPDTKVDLIHSDFFAEALVALIMHRTEGIFNISSGIRYSLRELCRMVIDYHGEYKGKVKEDSSIKIPSMNVDNSKLINATQLEYNFNKYNLEEFLKKYIEVRRFELGMQMAVNKAMSEPVVLDMTAEGAIEAFEKRRKQRMLDYAKIFGVAGKHFKDINIGAWEQRAKDLGVIDEEGNLLSDENSIGLTPELPDYISGSGTETKAQDENSQIGIGDAGDASRRREADISVSGQLLLHPH